MGSCREIHFGKVKIVSRKKEGDLTLPWLRFVEGRNREHYLFSALNSGEGTNVITFFDVEQAHTAHWLAAQGMIRLKGGGDIWQNKNVKRSSGFKKEKF
jgi:hypothetical protein